MLNVFFELKALRPPILYLGLNHKEKNIFGFRTTSLMRGFDRYKIQKKNFNL